VQPDVERKVRVPMDESAVNIVKNETMTVVSINGPMTIDRIGEIRDGMLQAFGLGNEVRLSMAAVTEVDLTGLQLLCSSHRTAIAKGLAFSVQDTDAEALSSVIELAGMWRYNGCSQDTGGTCVWKREII